MKKIVSLFARNYDGNRLVRNEVVPGAEWVLNGEGKATLKIDGTSCLVQDGKFYKRYDAKKGKNPPEDFLPAQPEADGVTGHWPGWVPVKDTPADRYHLEAVQAGIPEDGTYELVGPKIQGNPHGLEKHILIRHGSDDPLSLPEEPPRDFDGLGDYFTRHDLEGVVWHHQDGRMVKIKKRDFGLKWGGR